MRLAARGAAARFAMIRCPRPVPSRPRSRFRIRNEIIIRNCNAC